MKNRLFYCILIVMGSLLLTACNKGEVFYQFREIKNAEWNVDSLLVLELDTLRVKAGVPYDISLEVTNNISYPYQNLWIFSEYVQHDSVVIKREVEYTLAGEDGVWKGKGFGSLYQSSHLVVRSHRFDDVRDMKIYIKHGMTDSVLKGVEKVGVKIEQAK